MVDPVHEGHEDSLQESATHGEHDSDMRSFIESGKQLVWTEEFGNCSGSHCQIGNTFPFVHQGKIKDGKAAIDRYIVDEEKAPRTFLFKDPFIAKTIHDTNEEKVRDRWIREVNAMKDLRHPHIAAFLGTWEHLGRLSILIYPVAHCDLQLFLAETDAELQKLRSQSALEDYSPSDLTTMIASDSLKEENKLNVSKDNITTPLELSCLKRLMMIRKFFYCLCRALSYIHRSGVRHKDIKPANILIDQSGSIVVTDFGISKVFLPNEPHDTNDEPKFSWKYASPEMIERTVLRGDPSDVYSLGCVFLEMATLVRGESFKNLSDHYVVSENEIKRAEDYYLNLDGVYSWIEHLRSLRAEPERPQGREVYQRASSLSPSSTHEDQEMVASCLCIRDMLSRNPDDRPKSEKLFQSFASVALQPCRDCDPRHPNVWKESAQQKKQSAEIRHSLRVISAVGFYEDDEGPSKSNNSPHGPVHQFSREAEKHNITSSTGPTPNIPLQLMRTPPPSEELHTTMRHRNPLILEEVLKTRDARATDPEEGRLAADQPTLNQSSENLERTTVAGMGLSNSDAVTRLAEVMIYNFEKQITYKAPFLTIEGLSALCNSLLG